METLKGILSDLIVEPFKGVYGYIVEFLPKLALGVLILAIGWICAVLFRKIIAKFLKMLGFDELSEKIGLKKLMEKGKIDKDPSYAIGIGFYWVVIISALVLAFNTLELELAANLIETVVLFIPKIIVALILFGLGVYISKLLGEFVQTSALLGEIPHNELLSKVASYTVMGITIVMILEYLNVAPTIVAHSYLIIFVVLPLFFVLMFLIGGKDIMASIIAGKFLTKELKKGEKIEFDSISGEIQSIGQITTRIKNEKEEFIIPNSELVHKTIHKGFKGKLKQQAA